MILFLFILLFLFLILMFSFVILILFFELFQPFYDLFSYNVNIQTKHNIHVRAMLVNISYIHLVKSILRSWKGWHLPFWACVSKILKTTKPMKAYKHKHNRTRLKQYVKLIHLTQQYYKVSTVENIYCVVEGGRKLLLVKWNCCLPRKQGK